jgi:hypothetical protein
VALRPGDLLRKYLGQTLGDAERLLRREVDLEVACVLDEGNHVSYVKPGELGAVRFRDSEKRNFWRRVVTHNHPGGDSLTIEDVLVAWAWELPDLRAVGPRYVYSMRQPLQGWRAYDWEKVDAIARREGPTLLRKADSGLIDRDRIAHIFWEGIAIEAGLDYTAAEVEREED